ncbi:MAG: 3-methyl-2-oxobutanoate hydroxymethyltransferase [Phycisphaeraceae bacterium]|nr:3-methyl-2-oxobutanoate hydroxymethyltransferase [Phycisphaeraceae bacterium]
MADSWHETDRVTLRTLREHVKAGHRFAMLTCYDATTARWLWRGGVRTLLVGDTAAQMILGHETTLPVSLDFMLELTAAVRRGAPGALVIGDLPFSAAATDDAILTAGSRFLSEGGADLVKIECDAGHAEVVEHLNRVGVPVVCHLGSRPQSVRMTGGYRAAGRDESSRQAIIDGARTLVDAGAAAILIEAVDETTTDAVVAAVGDDVPVIGCGAGPACHGEVVVLHDLLGLSDWQPPFAPPAAEFGPQLEEAARNWARHVEEDE